MRQNLEKICVTISRTHKAHGRHVSAVPEVVGRSRVLVQPRPGWKDGVGGWLREGRDPCEPFPCPGAGR